MPHGEHWSSAEGPTAPTLTSPAETAPTSPLASKDSRRGTATGTTLMLSIVSAPSGSTAPPIRGRHAAPTQGQPAAEQRRWCDLSVVHGHAARSGQLR